MTTPQELEKLAFLGLSATGPEPFRHGVFEVALVVPWLDFEEVGPDDDEIETVDWHERHWWLAVDLGGADPEYLRRHTYHERHPLGHADADRLTHDKSGKVTDPGAFATTFARLSRDRYLVCNAQAEFYVRALLLAQNECPMWRGVVDVASLGVGFLAGAGKVTGEVSWLPDVVARVMGVNMGTAEIVGGTATGDARLARAVYETALDA
jgi:hypothetical protein